MKKKRKYKNEEPLLVSTHPSFFSQRRKSRRKCKLVLILLFLKRDVEKKERSANPLCEESF
jgi:hypothetical protein